MHKKPSNDGLMEVEGLKIITHLEQISVDFYASY